MASKGPEPSPDHRSSALPSAAEPVLLRFGVFELDHRSGELRRAGSLVKLQQQPFRVLWLLASRPGELITREEIRAQIWGETYVDFDQGLNFCIKRIRAALGDHAVTPRYVETLPRRGYRFVAPVEKRSAAPAATNSGPGPRAVPFRPATSAPEPAPPTGRGPRRTAFAAGIVVVLAGLGFVAWRQLAGPPIPAYQRLTFRRGTVEAARFGSDGEVVYGAAWDGGLSETHVTRDGAPDTRVVGFPRARLVGVVGPEAALLLPREDAFPVLARAPLAGGLPREILEGVVDADWSADGASFAVVRRVEDETRIEYPVGTVLLEAAVLRTSHLRLCPRGRGVAFLEHPVAGDDRGYVVFLDRDGRKTRLTTEWGSLQGLAWAKGGDEIWFTGAKVGADSALYAVDLDGRERLITRGPGRLVLHDVAPDGRVLLSRAGLRLELRALAPGATSERDLSWLDLPYLADLSDDGRTVLFGESGEAGGPGYSIFVRGTDGSPPVRLGEGRPMALSPDGRWVLSIPLEPPLRIVVLPAGPGQARVLTHEGLQDYLWADWLPDGRRILFAASEGGRPRRIFVQDLESGPPRPVTPEGTDARQCHTTADGRYVAAKPPGAAACLLYPIEGGEPMPIPGVESGDYPVGWGSDGRSLYVRRGSLPVQVYRIDLGSGRRELWRELAPSDPAGVMHIARVAITPDARGYAYAYARFLSELYLVRHLD